MVVLTVAECNFPLLQFFAPLSVKLQASVTGSTDVIPEYVTHVVQHANHTCRDGVGWQGTAFRCWWSTFKCSLLLHHLYDLTDDHIAHWLELLLLRERYTFRLSFRVKTKYLAAFNCFR